MNTSPEHLLVVAGLIWRKDRLLLVRQQGPDDLQPYWTIPGGIVEPGESLQEALAREVREETGLDAQEPGRMLYTTWSGHDTRYSAIVFNIEAWSGTPDADDPDGLVQEARFVDRATAFQRLERSPYRIMREPLLATLEGRQPQGAVWFYTHGLDAIPVVKSSNELDRWRNLDYLLAGTRRQRLAHATLSALDLADRLDQFDPLLIGTIPIDVDVEGSDLDIACWAGDPDQFVRVAATHFGHLPHFRSKQTLKRGLPTAIVRFCHADFEIELFAQPLPPTAQYGLRHMLVEDRLLALGADSSGPRARRQIRLLKRRNWKTEPAFAHYFDISGDPYEELWKLSLLDDHGLKQTIADDT